LPMSIFAMSIWSAAFRLSRAELISRWAMAFSSGLVCLRRWAVRGASRTGTGLASVRRWAFSFLTAFLTTIASTVFPPILAFMLRVTIGRRWLADPRRQHLQVD